jgi:biopolymer transport protein ExbD
MPRFALLPVSLVLVVSLGVTRTAQCQVAQGIPSRTTTSIYLYVGTDQPITINRQPIPLDDLHAQLRAIYEQRPTKRLYVGFGPKARAEALEILGSTARELGIELLPVPPNRAFADSGDSAT